MSDDWPQKKARLAADAAALAALPQNLDKRAGEELAADIRAALQRVADCETAFKMQLVQLAAKCQRVSDLEQESKQTSNYCLLCEHYARAAEKLNDENRSLRQRVEELERDRAAVDEVLVEVRKQGSLREIDCANETLRAEAAEAEHNRLREENAFLREALRAISILDHHNHSNPSEAGELARAALRGGE